MPQGYLILLEEDRQAAEKERERFLDEQEAQAERDRQAGNLAMGLNTDGSAKPESRDVPNL